MSDYDDEDVRGVVHQAMHRAKQIERDNTWDNTEFQKAVNLALQEALKVWLDEKFAQLGKWTLGSILAAGLAAIMWLIFKSNGYIK